MAIVGLQYKPSVGILKHSHKTSPVNEGKLMAECCCNTCQWAIDWIYVCIGACVDGAWTGGAITTLRGDYHGAPAWAASTVYGTPGQLVQDGGTLYALKIKHTSGASIDTDYWISASGWIAYQNGAAGTVTPTTYPAANAYQVNTNIGLGGAAPAPGVHCAGAGNVGQSANLGGCSATRYGAIHHGVCPTTSDVSTSAPTECEESTMCGGCYQCGPFNPRCFDINDAPAVQPCAVTITAHIQVDSVSLNYDVDVVVPLVDCVYTSGIITIGPIYNYSPTHSPPTCPGGSPVIHNVNLGRTSTSPTWVLTITIEYCDPGNASSVFACDLGSTYECKPVGTFQNFSMSGGLTLTNPSATSTSQNP